jgi:hypothetical protein
MLNTNQCGASVRMAVDTTTGESGLQLRVQIAEAVVKGEGLSVSPSVDNKYIKQTNMYDVCAIAYEAGSADGFIWVWTTGAICQVLFADGVTVTRGYLATGHATDGRADSTDISVISGNPATDAHFKEWGHIKESKTSGTNVLALVHFHTL